MSSGIKGLEEGGAIEWAAVFLCFTRRGARFGGVGSLCETHFERGRCLFIFGVIGMTVFARERTMKAIARKKQIIQGIL